MKKIFLHFKGMFQYITSLFFKKKQIILKKEPQIVFSVEPIKEFLEEFIGVTIVGFKTFHDDIEDIEAKIQAKMIVGVEVKENDIWIKLAKLNGSYGGRLKVSPTINGEFAEKDAKDMPESHSIYRLMFFGGSAFEYLDLNGEGKIAYYAGFKG